jgi:hypothetical protein
MCTASLVPLDGGMRLLFNRDERFERPPAGRPAIRAAGTHAAVWPIDSRSGGTWIGVNDCGLVAALLNRTPDGPATWAATRYPASRGAIVPAALACATLDEAFGAIATADRHRMPPFRALVAIEGEVMVVTSVAGSFSALRYRLHAPMMLTSSSLSDALVGAPRRRLFAWLLCGRTDVVTAQRVFHDHQWPSHTEISVRMHRRDAATISRTGIDVRAGRAVLRYETLPLAGRLPRADSLELTLC